MQSMYISITRHEFTEVKNKLFNELKLKNSKLKSTVFQDKIANLFTNGKRNWSSIMSTVNLNDSIRLPLFEMSHSSFGFQAEELESIQQKFYSYVESYKEWTLVERHNPLLYVYFQDHEWKPVELAFGRAEIVFDINKKLFFVTFTPFQVDSDFPQVEYEDGVFRFEITCGLNHPSIMHFLNGVSKNMSNFASRITSYSFKDLGAVDDVERPVDKAEKILIDIYRDIKRIENGAIKKHGLLYVPEFSYKLGSETSKVIINKNKDYSKHLVTVEYDKLWDIKFPLTVRTDPYWGDD